MLLHNPTNAMKYIKQTCFFLFLTLSYLTSCQNPATQEAKLQSSLAYAKGFDIDYSNKEYTQVTVFNPWNPGTIYETYFLIKDTAVQTPTNGQTILIPIKELVINSATHLGFAELLGINQLITGVCNPDYIYNPHIIQRVKEGKIKDLGDSFNLDTERLLLLRPDAIMTSAYNAEDENTKRLKQTGLTILYNIEWQEETVLGRAEWIKFVAAFFDKDSLAQELFIDIENKYNEAKSLVSDPTLIKPSVLTGQDFRGSWSMPGGKSFNAQLLSDAGINYHYADNQDKGSINSTIEEALVYFNKADIWINAQVETLEQLGAMDQRYKLFKAYKSGEVYNSNKRMNKKGGNDYWELGVARPDLLLKDLIKIAHPHLLSDYELTFMDKLK